MTRLRGRIRGGYTRKTLSLPAALVKRIEKHLARSEPEVTMSAFITKAAEQKLRQLEGEDA